MNTWRLVNPETVDGVSILGHHNHWMCLLAVIIGIFSSAILLPITQRYQYSHGSYRRFWLLAGSISMGCGIWAMHFTGMMAFSLPVAVRYDASITIASIIPAILASAFCIHLSQSGFYSISQLCKVALIMALGIGGMHYTGMEAMITPAEMYYEPGLFFESIIAAFVLAFVGLYSFFRLPLNHYIPTRVSHLIGAVILGLAISGMHFIAMKATYFITQHAIDYQSYNAPSGILVTGVLTAVAIMLGFICVSFVLDKKLSSMADSLKQSEMKFERLAETTQTAIFTFSKNHILYSNPALSNITGYETSLMTQLPIENVLGKQVHQFVQDVFDSHVPFGQALYMQFEITTANGEHKWLHFSFTLAEFDDVATGIASACDISEQKNAELRMRELAFKDPLTQLANRAMFIERLEHHLALLDRKDDSYKSCVMMLDLDNFKLINDVLGHQKGDKLLQSIAERLMQVSRKSDTVARLGGDEFIILLEEVASDTNEIMVAERIQQTLIEPYDLDGNQVDIKLSMGIYQINKNDKNNMDAILNNVDIALYRAKTENKGSWVLFDENLDAHAKRERILQSEFKHAIYNGELNIHLQPIIDPYHQKIAGAEALMRWRRSNGEHVAPFEFIPIAEKSGLISEMTLWLIESVAKTISTINQLQDKREFYISINASSASFHDEDFYRLLKDIHTKSEIDTAQLKIEITESMFMKPSQYLDEKLNSIVQLGYKLMLDDFGTGYSNLSYLHTMPVSTLKIDRSFVLGLNSDNSSMSLIRSIITLAQNLDMKTVVEGVETDAQFHILSLLGCDLMQGYLFEKPIPEQELLTILKDPEWYEKLQISDESKVRLIHSS